MVALGCSGIRAVSRFTSAILADFAVRGFAISFLTLACVALPGSFLLFCEFFGAALSASGVSTVGKIYVIWVRQIAVAGGNLALEPR
jgi:hypothetical protein